MKFPRCSNEVEIDDQNFRKYDPRYARFVKIHFRSYCKATYQKSDFLNTPQLTFLLAHVCATFQPVTIFYIPSEKKETRDSISMAKKQSAELVVVDASATLHPEHSNIEAFRSAGPVPDSRDQFRPTRCAPASVCEAEGTARNN